MMKDIDWSEWSREDLKAEVERLIKELKEEQDWKRRDRLEASRVYASMALTGLITKVPLVDRDSFPTIEEGKAACRKMRAEVAGSAFDYAAAMMAEEEWREDKTGKVQRPDGVVEFLGAKKVN